MHPAIDQQGQIWFGEMSRNYLGAFDPRSRNFRQETPPDGKSGIMGLVVAPDKTIWFAEQYANYIGHFLPQSNRYRIYPLPIATLPDPAHPGQTQRLPSAPNELALDQHGVLWFTELNANAIGSLNTLTGAMHQYALTDQKNAPALDPYGIAVDPRGGIWFSEASANRLGQLDPLTGKISYFSPPGVSSPLMELASDAQGRIWATTFATGLLLQFDPTSGRFTSYSLSGPGNNVGGLYGLLVASSGDIWVAITSQNSLARFNVQQQRFFTYAIPTPNSLPIGLVEDHNHAIWFTESGSDKIGVLQSSTLGAS
jgi:streptogramin lyase